MPDDRKVAKLTCPYNVAHEIVPERFQGHLFKCREQYKVSEFVPCPFNAAHDVPVPELPYHKQICPDRLKIDKMRFRIGEVQEDVAMAINPQIDLPDDDENWDNHQPTQSYLQIRDDVIEQKAILRLPMGETKSKRKNFYQNELFRFEEVANEKEVHEPRVRPPKSSGRGGVMVDKYFRDPSPDSYIGMGRGSSGRKPQSSVGETSDRIGAGSSLRRPLENSVGGSASKSSKIKEEPTNSDDDDEGYQIVVRSKGRGRAKFK